jgi:hypothetical protein
MTHFKSLKPNFQRSFLRVLLLVLFSACAPVLKKANVSPPAAPGNNVLFVLGQSDVTEMNTYMQAFAELPAPDGFSFYTNLEADNTNRDFQNALSFMEKHPGAIFHLAVWTGGNFATTKPGYYLDEISLGFKDKGIKNLANALKRLNRPVLLRFGYEFDGYHNAYPPYKYKTAYRYFVDALRKHGVRNVAFVWHSWGTEPYYGHNDFPVQYPELPEDRPASFDLWYPGDDYVDWMAVSIFGAGYGNLLENKSIMNMAALAKAHKKPLMIAEAAAIKTWGGRDTSWRIPDTNWFRNVFTLMHQVPEVKAFVYINVDWGAHNPADTWGNSRIQDASPEIQAYWREQLRRIKED